MTSQMQEFKLAFQGDDAPIDFNGSDATLGLCAIASSIPALFFFETGLSRHF
jgi:hypothetical protein